MKKVCGDSSIRAAGFPPEGAGENPAPRSTTLQALADVGLPATRKTWKAMVLGRADGEAGLWRLAEDEILFGEVDEVLAYALGFVEGVTHKLKHPGG